MRVGRISEVKIEIAKVEIRLDELVAALTQFEDPEGRAFELSATIPGTDATISDIRARQSAIAGLARKLNPKGGIFVPLSLFNGTMNSLRAITNSIDQLLAEILNARNQAGVQSFDFTSFNVTTKTGQIFSFQASFKALFDNSEIFLSNFNDLFQIVRPDRAAFNFEAAAKSLSTVISNASTLNSNLNESLNSSQKTLKKIQEIESEFSTLILKANSDATSITDQAGRTSEALTQINAALDKSKAITDRAQIVSDQVAQYDVKFKSFDASLNDREKAIQQGSKDIEVLKSDFLDQKEFISTLIEQSDKMLSGATVAGLASEFKNLRDDLTLQLASAHTAFNISIGLLFVSAVPLVIFIFSPLIAPLVTSEESLIEAIAQLGTEKSGWQYLGQVVARFIILLPALWFVTFCTKRYNSLFKLKEHYSYKYSMAMAVDGFKKQAPGHEDLIAALIFEQLAFNPADKLGSNSSDDTSERGAVMDILLNILRKKAGDEAA
jgi:hypothetical protein